MNVSERVNAGFMQVVNREEVRLTCLRARVKLRHVVVRVAQLRLVLLKVYWLRTESSSGLAVTYTLAGKVRKLFMTGPANACV